MERRRVFFVAHLRGSYPLNQLMVISVCLGPGGLDSWDPPMKGIVT